MSSSSNDCVIIDDCDLTDDEPGPSRLVHKPGACEVEMSWFEQLYQKPTSQVIDSTISSEDISKYQNLIWNQPHDRMVPGYGLTPRELASIPSDGRKGWLVTSHFFWLSRCLNKRLSQARCFVFDPHLRQEAVDKLLPVSCRTQVKTLILVMCVGRQDDGMVFFGTNKMQGDHWSVSVVDIRDGTVFYCDTLGWPAPYNLSSNIIKYTRLFGLVHTRQLNVKLSHSANKEQHSCTQECTNYPLQTCSDVCGVVVMICMTIAALDTNLFSLLMQPLDRNLNLYLTDPTEYSTYLRYVLMSWLAKGSIDMQKISLKPDFNPHVMPSPRSLAKRTPMKHKIAPEEDGELPKTSLKKLKFERKADPLSDFIINAKKGGLSSSELLREVLQFTKKGPGRQHLENCPLNELCEHLSFNSAVERCQDHLASMREYIHDFIQRPDSPVILFKLPSKKCKGDSKTLEKNDLMVAIQTPYQKQTMEIYGRHCICVNLTKKSEKFSLSCNLFTISVVFQGLYEIPVAWLLSTSHESHILRYFFEAVRRNVGEVQTNIFIGDIQNEFYKQWIQFFPKPQKKMFCSWEVFQLLSRQMRNFISNQEGLTSCKEYLSVIRFITDEDAFNAYINAFLVVAKQHSVTFYEYMKEKFLSDSRAEFWATCYRILPYCEIIPFLKPFHETLRTVGFFDNGALNRIDVVFHKLMQFSGYLQRSLIEISSEAKQITALKGIQRKHQERGGNPDYYRSLSGDEWCIRASDDNNTITVVDTGMDSCDCVFKCEACGICLHRYVCSCSAYLLNPWACNHIHVLHSIRKVNGVINTEDSDLTLSHSQRKPNKKRLDNGSLDDVDYIKSSVQKELMRISEKTIKSLNSTRLKCLLKDLQDI